MRLKELEWVNAQALLGPHVCNYDGAIAAKTLFGYYIIWKSGLMPYLLVPDKQIIEGVLLATDRRIDMIHLYEVLVEDTYECDPGDPMAVDRLKGVARQDYINRLFSCFEEGEAIPSSGVLWDKKGATIYWGYASDGYYQVCRNYETREWYAHFLKKDSAAPVRLCTVGTLEEAFHIAETHFKGGLNE